MTTTAHIIGGIGLFMIFPMIFGLLAFFFKDEVPIWIGICVGTFISIMLVLIIGGLYLLTL